MNPCQFCGAAATVHVTDIVSGKKREAHLCEKCARAHDLLPTSGPQINLQALLQLVFNPPAGGPAAAGLTCPDCGLQYAQFRVAGRLGCPADYDLFKDDLEPLLARVHRGTGHAGKVPRSVERESLKAKLAAAVAVEDYEEAARLRDRLRAVGDAAE